MLEFDPLVSVDWLAGKLARGAGNIRLLDGTWSMPNEAPTLPAGYIPNSAVFDIDEIADKTSEMAHMLPSADIFCHAVSQMGITPEDTVVIYDRHGAFSAPRVWWTFRMFGHRDVRVLDGGLPAWIKAGQSLEASPAVYPPSNYAPMPALAAKAELEDVLRAQHKDGHPSGMQIIDARPEGRFKGLAPEPRKGLTSGHMPGALNVPFGSLRTAQMAFRPLSEIAQLFKTADISAPIITSCGSGITAAGLAFQLARLGAKDVAVYDGSWSEYGAKANLPVARSKITKD